MQCSVVKIIEMFDTFKFIECVQGQSAIWNSRTNEYSDIYCRKKAWREIGKAMYNGWLELKPHAMDKKVSDMKKEWRNIKKCYVMYLNQEKSDEPAAKKKKYVDALGFLNTFVKKKRNKSEGKNAENGEETNVGHSTAPSTSKKPSPKIEQPGHSRRSTRTIMPLYLTRVGNAQDEDPDKDFILSLLPDYKTLNNDEKMNYRSFNFQFFRNIRQNSNSQNISYSSSTPPPLHFHQDHQPPQHSHQDQQPPLHSLQHQQPPLHFHQHQQPPLHFHQDQQPHLYSHQDQQPPLNSHQDQQPPLNSHQYQQPPLHSHQHQQVIPVQGLFYTMLAPISIQSSVSMNIDFPAVNVSVISHFQG